MIQYVSEIESINKRCGSVITFWYGKSGVRSQHNAEQQWDFKIFHKYTSIHYLGQYAEDNLEEMLRNKD
jgi:hypothetical protein